MKAFLRAMQVVTVFLICTIFSCTTLKQESLYDFQTAPLFGMIYDYDNKPCPDVKTTVDGEEGPTSDINGRFVIRSMSRGEHRITCMKDGYEKVSMAFQFTSRNQVLYVRMISFNQLLDSAEKAIDCQHWKEGKSLIQRAERIKQNDPLALYLTAILLKERGEAQQAVEVLLNVLNFGFQGPYVYIALADIYQYQLNDFHNAARYLEKYVKVESNWEAQKRLDELRMKIENLDIHLE
jgi:tetratricopeptide (TPR) repeat protein